MAPSRLLHVYTHTYVRHCTHTSADRIFLSRARTRFTSLLSETLISAVIDQGLHPAAPLLPRSFFPPRPVNLIRRLLRGAGNCTPPPRFRPCFVGNPRPQSQLYFRRPEWSGSRCNHVAPVAASRLGFYFNAAGSLDCSGVPIGGGGLAGISFGESLPSGTPVIRANRLINRLGKRRLTGLRSVLARDRTVCFGSIGWDI